jgi:L-threonylcarbamoyladenylate synthase
MDPIDEAVRLLRAGKLVAFPTETVYGLGADATDDRAVAAIFDAKGRPRFNPLITHYAEAAAAAREVTFTPLAERLAARFWPGPLTLVLPRRAGSRVSLLCSAGLDSLGVRVPHHPLALDLLRRFGRPLAGPSANPSGRLSPTTAQAVREGLEERVALVLDGGATPVGLESTVLDLTGAQPALLRPGAVTREELEAIVGPLAKPDDGPLKSPGRLASHYAPTLPLRLEATSVRSDEALLAFGLGEPEGAAKTLNLSVRGDLVEAAANLFAYLRRLDRPGFAAIAVAPIPAEGLGEAINDRLRRAAAPRTDPTAS